MKLIIAGLLGLLFGSFAQAQALQIAVCPEPAGANPTGYAAPALTARGRVSNSSDGSNAYCKEISAMSETAFVLTSSDGGKTTSWQEIKTVLAGAQVTPPKTPIYLANATMTWTPPTTDTLGRTLSLPLTYNVYRGASATTLTKLTSVSVPQYSDPATNATPMTFYYAVTATCGSCVESGKSGVVSATIASGSVKTGPPGNVALKCTLTPAPPTPTPGS